MYADVAEAIALIICLLYVSSFISLWLILRMVRNLRFGIRIGQQF